MIEVNKLVKLFGAKKILRDLNFNAAGGEFVILLGPNGAGKTTFLRILASLMRPTAGEIHIAGYSLPAQAAAVRARLGVVTHQPLLYGELTALENLRFFARLYGVHDREERIREVLEQMGLLRRKNELVRTFSRGMQQRLAIGRAIVHRPEVLLFDEPHTGLDQEACDVLDEILSGVISNGQTVVMSSHDLYRAKKLATRIDILSRGKITSAIGHQDFINADLSTLYQKALE